MKDLTDSQKKYHNFFSCLHCFAYFNLVQFFMGCDCRGTRYIQSRGIAWPNTLLVVEFLVCAIQLTRGLKGPRLYGKIEFNVTKEYFNICEWKKNPFSITNSWVIQLSNCFIIRSCPTLVKKQMETWIHLNLKPFICPLIKIK